MSRCTRDFDYIIVDAPPVFVAETSAIVQRADLLILTARPGVVRRNALNHALTVIGRFGGLKALVLNGVAREHTDYHSSVYNYYYAEADDESDQSNTQVA